MAERSFKKEVALLRASDGEVFRGEGILAITKALLQSGVSYVGGYQGSPISHLMDVLNDAQEVLSQLGVHFESSGSEASAAAMLSASVNYPLRGAVTWKSTVGTNVASDALANLASSGVTGGAMVIVGEDYGEGSSIMQERTYGFAMKSQMWLLDPRPELSLIVDMVKKGFELSEASNTPLFFLMRIRSCHMTGEFKAKNNASSSFGTMHPVKPKREEDKIILPPNIFEHEQEKIVSRLPAALDYITANKLNEIHPGRHTSIGIITCGGTYNTLIRALERQGVADCFGKSDIPIYVLNVTYPLVPTELLAFCDNKTQVLLVEEGQPAYMEAEIRSILHQKGISTQIHGKDMLPKAGEYTGQVMLLGITSFLEQATNESIELIMSLAEIKALDSPFSRAEQDDLIANVPPRPSGLCTGCPERPLFSAIKQLQQEMEPFHISSDIGCHSFATLAPFNLGNTIMGYGLALASTSSIRKVLPHPAISIMGDGGFWHNGLSTGVASAVFNQHDGILIIINNGYTAATGGQNIPSRLITDEQEPANLGEKTYRIVQEAQSIEDACVGAGVKWIKTVSSYDIAACKNIIREALTINQEGLKVIVATGECMLNRQRRERPIQQEQINSGDRVMRSHFYVDPQTCTGDHACIRISGCPSLTIKNNPDPLKIDPVAHVDNSCVGCGVCGDNVLTAVLCPSFSEIKIIDNPSLMELLVAGFRSSIIGWMQRRLAKRKAKITL